MNDALEADEETAAAGSPEDAVPVAAIREAVAAEDQAALSALLEPLHAADVADLLEQLARPERLALIRLWGIQLDGSVLSELEEGVRDEIVAELPDHILAAAVQEMETDDVVYLAEDLDEPQQERILRALDAIDRVAVEASLQYGDYTAGRLMQREVGVAPEHWSVGDALDFMRAEDWLPESFYDLIIVDPQMRPVGMVSLGRIMGAPRPTRLKELMDEDFRTIRVDEGQDDVAYVFNKYHLISAPVVDTGGRLVGVITIDDAMEVLEEETEEDLRRLGGVGDEELSDGVVQIARSRFPWLVINVFTTLISASVIGMFSHTIEVIVALAILMPIVSAMGGNAGTQSLTVTVRAIATRSISAANLWRVIRREGAVGLVNGIAFAVIMGCIAGWYFADPGLGVVIAAAMFGNMVVAAFAGVLVPIGLEKVGIDPALASSIFVTTMTDCFGFFAFLGLATYFLL